MKSNPIDNCPACGQRNIRIAAELTDERAARYAAFSRAKYGGLLEAWLGEVPPIVNQCLACGHCWYRHQPDPDKLRQMYASARRLGANTQPSRSPTQAMICEMKKLRRIVHSGDHAPEFLDFGSGYGRWARAAVQAGFSVTAYEPSSERGAEDRPLPFNLVHDDKDLSGRHFHAIQLEQVLEHVPDPLATLEGIKQYCTGTTIVRITVPNILRAPEGKDVWASWPFNGSSPHIMAPFEHLHGFTPESLLILARRAGFLSIPIKRITHYSSIFALRIVASKFNATLATTFLLLYVPTQHALLNVKQVKNDG